MARGNGGGPVGFILTRQGIPVLEGTDFDGVSKGGCVLGGGKPADDADVIIIGTGSELQLAVEAKKLLAEEGHHRLRRFDVRGVVREPAQGVPRQVLPPEVSARVAVEAAVAQNWHKLAGDTGEIVSIEHYGESADDKTLFREFGFTLEAVVAAAERSMDN